VKEFLPYRIGVASSFTCLQVRRIEKGGYGRAEVFAVHSTAGSELISIVPGETRRTL
jgi:hypothetical protein